MNKDYFGKDLSVLTAKKLFLFDMDGTIYLDKTLFRGVNELLDNIVKANGKYVFITNNSSKSVKDYILKLHGLGVPCDESNFFTSSQASAILLNDKHKGERIYAQGTKSFIEELIKNGINLTEEYDESAKVVIVGFDTELTSEKMRTTSKMLTNLSVPYYATNPDWVCPVDFGYVPDCGSMCFGYEKATGKAPVYIGKPNPMMINLAVKKFNASPLDTVVIGDRIYTDIASGYNASVDTVLVLSGEATLKDYNESDIKPTFVLNGIWDFPKPEKQS